jgi:hypothetical protein
LERLQSWFRKEPQESALVEGLEAQARADLRLVESKIKKLVNDFAQGLITRRQFDELYAHYQRRREFTKAALESPTGLFMQEEEMEALASTSSIRLRYAARPLGGAVYLRGSESPLHTEGDFPLNSERVNALISSFHAASAELFRTGIRSEIEDGHWLCLVPGRFSMLAVVFSQEPPLVQLALLEDLHRDFEQANASALMSSAADAARLVYPYATVLKKRSS